jgi:glycosyltransferase involved in cell wall biosynthesis
MIIAGTNYRNPNVFWHYFLYLDKNNQIDLSDQINKYKICMVSDQLGTGGAERCAGLLSIFFEKNNCKVHHVVVVDVIEYDYAGEVLNLGKLKNESNDFFNRLKRFRALNRFFKDNHFDFIIDFRVKRHQWQEFVIAKYVYRSPLIVMIHSFMLDLYFPRLRFLANSIYSSCHKIVTVSEGIKKEISATYYYRNLQTIYNPIDLNYIENLDSEELHFDFKFILAVGRLQDHIKQFDQLIIAYANSQLPSNDIRLIIVGDGVVKQELMELSKKLNLENKIIFKGKVTNPYLYYKPAFFTILSSKNEGLPMVILESLACGTPVVSFDCLSGPAEMITNMENGILVENQNFEKLIDAMHLMVDNEELYAHCKQNAKSSVENFSIEKIGMQWLELMNINQNDSV